jgi:hypothetical protein
MKEPANDLFITVMKARRSTLSKTATKKLDKPVEFVEVDFGTVGDVIGFTFNFKEIGEDKALHILTCDEMENAYRKFHLKEKGLTSNQKSYKSRK